MENPHNSRRKNRDNQPGTKYSLELLEFYNTVQHVNIQQKQQHPQEAI
jgi:hypothetical protein